jgi:hypothetical protein
VAIHTEERDSAEAILAAWGWTPAQTPEATQIA